MNIAELRAGTQQHNRSTGQAYIQVAGTLYPIADVVIQEEGLIIVAEASEEVVDEVDQLTPVSLTEFDDVVPVSATPLPEDTLSSDIIEAIDAGELSDEEAQGLLGLGVGIQ